MKKINILLWLFVILLADCGRKTITELTVFSPDNKINLIFKLYKTRPCYLINVEDKPVILTSALGFNFKYREPLDSNFVIKDYEETAVDETWEQPWGEKRIIRNNYNQLTIFLEEAGNLSRKLNIVFRVYNDGVGLRYEIPEQENMDSIFILDEKTEFVFPDNQFAWWIPAYRDNRYEYLYKKSPVNELDTVHTPLTLETRDSLYLCIHEADLTDYASMTLAKVEENTLKCDLIPWSDGIKVKSAVPMVTPWRTIQIAENPGDLITSYLVLNLNEPNKLDDVSWIKPMKYIGIWWGMHTGLYTWEKSEKHGATTENTKKYIDFAAKYGFGGVLVEGWNVGWDGNWPDNADKFKFTVPYDDYDLKELCDYAALNGVKIIGHNETAAGIGHYEKQMEDAFKLYQELGINAVKTGYVGTRLSKKEWHHGQYGVRHFRRVIETAAKHKIMVNAHEPIKGTGIQRTYPNMLSREGARGQEYNAWSPDGGNPPEHETILPFTRLLAGPMDFTPGIFDIMVKEKPENRVNTTLAKQLALYVVIYSPLQMAADLPENYENNPAFQFILDVPVDWNDTRVLNGRIGDYVTIVRKDRNSNDWYLGSITDENNREFKIQLSFLDNDKKYIAEIYADADEADWETNPLAINISRKEVDTNTKIAIRLARGGGQAIRFKNIYQ
ncbi:MAG: alpha-glucosidase [Bacteroides sp. SM23_62_1]|nr:MAG: alpha-glucosidase [Bacteroides sp. SM23_62_1]